jgi:radical SAM superfamily enzyme
MLHIVKNTALGHLYQKEPFYLLSLEEYRDIVIKQITHLKEDIIIHRLTGDASKDQLIAPNWILKKFVVMNEIDKYMRANQLHQGIYYKQKE